MSKIVNPHDCKDTYGLFLKQSDVNYVYTNLVCTDKVKALDLAKSISDVCEVTCLVVDESFSILV